MTINPDEPVPLTCSDEDKERLKALARSTTAGIWRIKRAKALLGIMESIRPSRLMYQIRVPVRSIIKCIEQFKQHGMACFDEPERAPTEREERVEKMLAFLEKAPPFSCKSWDDQTVHYIGVDFSARQIFMIRQLIAEKQLSSRPSIAAAVCEMFGLQGLDGRPPQSKVVDILITFIPIASSAPSCATSYTAEMATQRSLTLSRDNRWPRSASRPPRGESPAVITSSAGTTTIECQSSPGYRQFPLPDSSLGSHAQPRLTHPGRHRTTGCRGLEYPLWPQACIAGNICRSDALFRNMLQSCKLGGSRKHRGLQPAWPTEEEGAAKAIRLSSPVAQAFSEHIVR